MCFFFRKETDSAAQKLNNLFLFRPRFSFRALCEPQNKKHTKKPPTTQATCPALVSGPPNRKAYKKHLIFLVFSVRTVNYGSSFFSIDLSVCNLQYGPKTRLILKTYLLLSHVWYLLGKESLHVFHPTLVCHNFE